MFVYIKWWQIVYKSCCKNQNINFEEMIECEFEVSDKLVYEDWVIKRYELSKQYLRDKKIAELDRENRILKFNNYQLRNENDKLLTEFDRMRITRDFNSFTIKNAK